MIIAISPGMNWCLWVEIEKNVIGQYGCCEDLRSGEGRAIALTLPPQDLLDLIEEGMACTLEYRGTEKRKGCVGSVRKIGENVICEIKTERSKP